VNPGQQELGSLLVTKQILNQTTYYLTKQENESYNNITMTWDDALLINYTNNSVLYFEELQLFKQTGDIIIPQKNSTILHFYEVNNNQSNGTIIVTTPQILVIDFYNINPAVQINFSPQRFELINQSQIVYMNITTPESQLAGELILKYGIQGMKTFNKTININPTTKWNITNTTLNLTAISIGSSGEFYQVDIKNTGNTLTTLNYAVTGTLTEIVTPPFQTLIYPEQFVKIKFLYQTNLLQRTGNYSGNIVIYNDYSTISKHFDIMLEDRVAPKIVSYTINNTMATVPTMMTIIANDNTGLNRTEYFCKELNGTILPVGNLFEKNITFNNVGSEKCDIFIYDNSENSINSTYNFIVERLQSIKYTSHTNFKKSWNTRFESMPFVHLDYPTNITFFLSNMVYNHSYSIRISNKNDEKFIKAVNESISFTDVVGDITFAMKGDVLDYYNGEFIVTGINQHSSLNPATFSGELVSYQPPRPFCNSRGNDTFCCTVKNEESVNASYICTLEFPGQIDVNQALIPWTIDEKNDYENATNTIITDREHTIRTLWIYIGVALVLMILLVIAYIIKKYTIDENYFFFGRGHEK
jgi:hypothetical protein